MKTKIEIGNLSDVGKKRTANEDYFGSYQGLFGNLIIVCDGMGGNKGGAFASRLAVNTIKEQFEKISDKAFNPKDILQTALVQADLDMKQKSAENEELKEMGSTAVVLLIKEGEAFTAHIGDSRIYMIRNKAIHQITKDHSLVQQMVDGGIITPEKAKEHPNKNVIVRSLGADGSSVPEIAEPFQIFKNDYFLLCSDGLTAYLSDEELLQAVLTMPLQAACQYLIDTANERGGKDNITVQIVRILKGKHLPLSKETKRKFLLGGSGIALILLCYVGFLFLLPLFQSASTPDKGQKPESKTEKPSILDSAEQKVQLSDSIESNLENAIVTPESDTAKKIVPISLPQKTNKPKPVLTETKLTPREK